MKSLSRVRLLATPWTAAHQAPPSMGFSRQEYWSGVPSPSPTYTIMYFQYQILKYSLFFFLNIFSDNVSFRFCENFIRQLVRLHLCRKRKLNTEPTSNLSITILLNYLTSDLSIIIWFKEQNQGVFNLLQTMTPGHIDFQEKSMIAMYNLQTFLN